MKEERDDEEDLRTSSNVRLWYVQPEEEIGIQFFSRGIPCEGMDTHSSSVAELVEGESATTPVSLICIKVAM